MMTRNDDFLEIKNDFLWQNEAIGRFCEVRRRTVYKIL